jgi:hypothetical protein
VDMTDRKQTHFASSGQHSVNMNTVLITYATRPASDRDDGFCPALPGFPKAPQVQRTHVKVSWLYAKYNLNKRKWEENNRVAETAAFESPEGVNEQAMYWPPQVSPLKFSVV